MIGGLIQSPVDLLNTGPIRRIGAQAGRDYSSHLCWAFLRDPVSIASQSIQLAEAIFALDVFRPSMMKTAVSCRQRAPQRGQARPEAMEYLPPAEQARLHVLGMRRGFMPSKHSLP